MKKIRVHRSRAMVVIGVIGLLFLFWASGILKLNANTTYRFSIPPSQLLPFASHADVRKDVCDVMKEGLFNEACKQDFDGIGKNDKAKIDVLFGLIEKIQNDPSISDYERYMLGQVIFSSLPTKDSPLARLSTRSFLTTRLKDVVEGNIAYAEELPTNEEEFRALMEQDLRAIADDLPEGDNAWVVQVMISRYSWINGKRQPIYSEEYAEWVDPYPASSDRNEQDIEFHVRSYIGGRSSGETYSGGGLYTGTSDDIFYSFTISSWQSQPDGGQEREDEDVILTTHYTEDGYTGDDLIGELFRKVNMEVPRESVRKRDKKAEESAKSDASSKDGDLVFVPIPEKECLEMGSRLNLSSFNFEYQDQGHCAWGKMDTNLTMTLSVEKVVGSEAERKKYSQQLKEYYSRGGTAVSADGNSVTESATFMSEGLFTGGFEMDTGFFGDCFFQVTAGLRLGDQLQQPYTINEWKEIQQTVHRMAAELKDDEGLSCDAK